MDKTEEGNSSGKLGAKENTLEDLESSVNMDKKENDEKEQENREKKEEKVEKKEEKVEKKDEDITTQAQLAEATAMVDEEEGTITIEKVMGNYVEIREHQDEDNGNKRLQQLTGAIDMEGGEEGAIKIEKVMGNYVEHMENIEEDNGNKRLQQLTGEIDMEGGEERAITIEKVMGNYLEYMENIEEDANTLEIPSGLTLTLGEQNEVISVDEVTGTYVHNEAGEVVPAYFIPIDIDEGNIQNYQVYEIVQCIYHEPVENLPDEAAGNNPDEDNDDSIEINLNIQEISIPCIHIPDQEVPDFYVSVDGVYTLVDLPPYSSSNMETEDSDNEDKH